MADRPRLVWIPAFSNGQMRRFDTTFYLDDVMLADQQAILDALVERPDWECVVKCLRGADSSAVLAARVAATGAAHVRYSEARLDAELGGASAALMDFPSSAMLECEAAGLPTLVLAYPGLRLREPLPARSPLVRVTRFADRAGIRELVHRFLDDQVAAPTGSGQR